MGKGLDGWVADKGIQPSAKRSIAEWFDEHPQAFADIQRGRELGLSRTQITAYLSETYDYPFTPNALGVYLSRLR